MNTKQTEALKLALEALEQLQGGCTDSDDGTYEAITVWCPEVIDAIREALAQPEQEPVAIVSGYYGGQCVILPIDPARIFNANTALYTSPPQSEQNEFNPDWDAMAVMVEEQQRMAKRIAELEAQQEPVEPYGWLYSLIVEDQVVNEKFTSVNWDTRYEPFGRRGVDHGGKVTKTPLYTTQPHRNPLSDVEIWNTYKNLWMFHPAEEPRLAGDILKFARAIEAAHGIKGDA